MAENDQNNEQQALAQDAPVQPMFAIEKLYVKDLSLEVPGVLKSSCSPRRPKSAFSLRRRSANWVQMFSRVCCRSR